MKEVFVEEKKPAKWLDLFLRYWVFLPIGTVCTFVLMLVMVIIDQEFLFQLCLMLGIAGIILQAVAMLLMLVFRRWSVAGGLLVGILISIFAGFISVIMTAAGQHHAPQPVDESMVADTMEVVEVIDSLETTDDAE